MAQHTDEVSDELAVAVGDRQQPVRIAYVSCEALRPVQPKCLPNSGSGPTSGKILTQHQGDQLPQWIKAVRADDLPSLHTFVNGFERDLAAVTAGLPLPWSSGVVEGHVNRIK
ncbi:hypothetical protein [Streptomyces sp. NPDC046197]|uniref:hypothetical protein n=1 Tax=Streptomyces sp. NPDC046197 TaxID=3154337 RepID=UPI00340D6037